MKSMSLLAIIPARANSLGLPGKHYQEIGGKSLIELAIASAKECDFISKLILSTNDQELIRFASELGCEVPFIRPDSLSSPRSSMIEVVMHALEYFPDYENYMVLQPTSPFRTALHIRESFYIFLNSNAPSCVSLSRAKQNPRWMFTINDNGYIDPIFDALGINILQRQDYELPYILNGAIYIGKTKEFLKNHKFITDKTVAYLMSEEDGVEIDVAEDLEHCRRIFLNKVQNDIR